mmetsp:Transcript_78308/g.123637  ORF Transcript_78308/g.123637 Transcript_78308/m.123637 type:complete len:99 (-) Transcript_78308:16-312(-)
MLEVPEFPLEAKVVLRPRRFDVVDVGVVHESVPKGILTAIWDQCCLYQISQVVVLKALPQQRAAHKLQEERGTLLSNTQMDLSTRASSAIANVTVMAH